MERDLGNAWKTMFKTMKYFQDQPACLAIATKIKVFSLLARQCTNAQFRS